MEATKLLSCVSSQIAAIPPPPSSGKSDSHCCRFRMASVYGGLAIQRMKWQQAPGAIGCVAPEPGPVVELERELEDEIKEGRLGEKCTEKVELLECLEREAIMGENQGRDPTDYNRRAQIFDKSSKVFQALKEQGQEHNNRQS